jgi:polyhydroxyalkanoate synthesis regulator phasin
LERRKEAREEIGKLVEERVDRVLGKLNIPSRSDFDELKAAIQKLSKKMKG